MGHLRKMIPAILGEGGGTPPPFQSSHGQGPGHTDPGEACPEWYKQTNVSIVPGMCTADLPCSSKS